MPDTVEDDLIELSDLLPIPKEGTRAKHNIPVTDEMVEKAWKAYIAIPKTRDVNGWRVAMRAALQAALT